jgi:hypothetical protein
VRTKETRARTRARAREEKQARENQDKRVQNIQINSRIHEGIAGTFQVYAKKKNQVEDIMILVTYLSGYSYHSGAPKRWDRHR